MAGGVHGIHAADAAGHLDQLLLQGALHQQAEDGEAPGAAPEAVAARDRLYICPRVPVGVVDDDC